MLRVCRFLQPTGCGEGNVQTMSNVVILELYTQYAYLPTPQLGQDMTQG